MTILTLGALRWWDGWLIWGVLLLVLGVRHPPPLDPYAPLDFKRKIAGWITLGILVVTFTPAPFTIQEPEAYQEQHSPEPIEPPLQVREKEVFDELETQLGSIFYDHHPPGGGALDLQPS